MKKRMIIWVLALVMALSLLPASALAASGTYGVFRYRTSAGSAIITGCSENVSGTVEIPAKINGYPVTEIDVCAFQFCNKMTRVVIPNGVRRIGMSAFWDCQGLKSVEIPSTVQEIGENAFWCCGLEQVTIPEGVTKLDCTFYHCNSLRSIYLPKSLKTIGSCTFSACDHLTDVYYGGTQAQWKQISVSSEPDEGSNGRIPNGNIQLQRATIHYQTAMADTGFSDVIPSDYFAAPVQWAVKKGITTGTGNGQFSPESPCTRGQIVTFLWRAKGCPEPKAKTSSFRDVSISEYYGKAVLWAAEKGIAQGMGNGLFAPNATVTRGQAVTFLWRAEEQPNASGSNPFRDVPTNEYFYQPVLWAVAHRVTNGTTANTFSPNAACTRAQIVTFLYRDLA